MFPIRSCQEQDVSGAVRTKDSTTSLALSELIVCCGLDAQHRFQMAYEQEPQIEIKAKDQPGTRIRGLRTFVLRSIRQATRSRRASKRSSRMIAQLSPWSHEALAKPINDASPGLRGNGGVLGRSGGLMSG